MNRKLIFVLINVLLVAVVGLILGFTLPLSGNNGLILSFVLLLVTLCIPTFLFLFVKDAASGFGIISIIFTVLNLAALIVFMCLNNKVDMKIIGITEASVIGAYLVSILVCIAMLPKKEN